MTENDETPRNVSLRHAGHRPQSATDNLRALEEDGLVDRTVYAEVPPRVVYSLSELSNTLRPVIDAMQEWGIGYKARLGQPE